MHNRAAKTLRPIVCSPARMLATAGPSADGIPFQTTSNDGYFIITQLRAVSHVTWQFLSSLGLLGPQHEKAAAIINETLQENCGFLSCLTC